MSTPVGIYSCSNHDCENFGTEFDKVDNYCPQCGRKLEIITYPESEQDEVKI